MVCFDRKYSHDITINSHFEISFFLSLKKNKQLTNLFPR